MADGCTSEKTSRGANGGVGEAESRETGDKVKDYQQTHDFADAASSDVVQLATTGTARGLPGRFASRGRGPDVFWNRGVFHV